jgi:hypothetical protein
MADTGLYVVEYRTWNTITNLSSLKQEPSYTTAQSQR